MPTTASYSYSKMPREKLLANGVESLSLEELLGLLVHTGTAGTSVMQVSQKVAQSLVHGRTDMVDLLGIPGLGVGKAASILAAMQLPSALERRKREQVITQPEEVYRHCLDLVSLQQEHLVVLLRDSKGGLLERHVVSIGTVSASLVHPREVFRPAILAAASSLILAHNHPSGDPAPSQADILATKQLIQAGNALGIQVMDHVICGRFGYVSLRSQFESWFSGQQSAFLIP